jgi:hypothetical protein
MEEPTTNPILPFALGLTGVIVGALLTMLGQWLKHRWEVDQETKRFRRDVHAEFLAAYLEGLRKGSSADGEDRARLIHAYDSLRAFCGAKTQYYAFDLYQDGINVIDKVPEPWGADLNPAETKSQYLVEVRRELGLKVETPLRLEGTH